MPGSSGRVSRIISPSTLMGERERQSDNFSSPRRSEVNTEVEGIIYEIHDKRLLVKAYNANNGKVIAGDRWIRLSHSPEEIRDNFGTIRKGMHVIVSCRGISGSDATARIMRIKNAKKGEGEESSSGRFLENIIELGLYEIFAPGIGR